MRTDATTELPANENRRDSKNDDDEPQHSIGDRDQELKTRAEFDSQEDYDEYCESCAI